MRPRHRATTSPNRPNPGRSGGWALIGLISMLILGLSYLFVSATDLASDTARGVVAVAALFLAILTAAGQWGWLVEETGLPIAEAIADELVRAA